MATENYFNEADAITVELSTVRQVDTKPDASGFASGDLIYDKTEGAFFESDGSVWVKRGVTANRVTSLSSLKTVDGSVTEVVYLDSGGRSGLFVWDGSNLSTEVTNDPGEGVYVPPDSDTTGASGAWVRQFDGIVDVRWFGAVPDDSTDSYQAFVDCLSAARDPGAAVGAGYIGSKPIYVAGEYYLSQTLNLHQTVLIFGSASPSAGTVANAVLRFPADTTGIIVNRYNTHDDTVTTGFDAADGAMLRNIQLSGGGGTTGDGIWLRARAILREVRVHGFGGNGIKIVATAGGANDREGNANLWELHQVECFDNNKSGVYLDGADVNAGQGIMVNARNNGEWGIYDSSFLGNTYTGCHTASNTSGAYKVDSPAGSGVLVGCYSEGGQPTSEVVHPTIVIGGIHGAGLTGSGFRLRSQTLTRFKVDATSTSNRAFETWLSRTDEEAITWLADGDASAGLAWSWNETGGVWEIRHARSGARLVLSITTNLNTFTAGRTSALGAGHLLVPQIWVGDRNIDASTAAPTTGEHARGDRVFKTNPSAGTRGVGFICVTGGTPGTWKAFGDIDA